MRDKKSRNSEMLNMWKSGLSRQEIAHAFDISSDRVRQIVKELDPEEKRKRRAQKILREIRISNNIEETWPREVIIEGLQLPKTVTWRLLRYFEAESISELSLKDFMDLLFVEHHIMPRNFREAFPICTGSLIGFKTHSSIIKHLTQQDLGEAFNAEWSKRLEELIAYLKRLKKYAPIFLRQHSYSLLIKRER